MNGSTPWAAVLPDYRCFGCSPHNQHGLRLEFHRVGETLECRFTLDRRFESYPGMVHGGITGTICDEVMGNLIVMRDGRSAFTTGIRLRYLAPLFIDRPYLCVARAHQAGESRYDASAEVLDEAGDLLVTAAGSFMPVDMDRAREFMDLTDDESESVLAALVETNRQNGA